MDKQTRGLHQGHAPGSAHRAVIQDVHQPKPLTAHTRRVSVVSKPISSTHSVRHPVPRSPRLASLLTIVSERFKAWVQLARRKPKFAVFGVVLILASIIIPILHLGRVHGSYDLSRAQSLLTPTPKYLQDKLKYDSASQQWAFNQNAAEQLPGDSGSSVNVGGVSYSAKLPVDLDSSEGGMSLSDAQRKLNLSFKPKFALEPAQQKEGYLVYPLTESNAQLVYSFKYNGTKEDIILYQSPGKTAQYSYELQLPSGMEARMQSDGSVGIFGGDPALFTNISYGSDKDKSLVEKARDNSSKTHLYYEIPAPIITGKNTESVKASFSLKDTELTITVTGLDSASYPLSIDPSFVMNTSGCKWQQSGNNDDNITYSGCQVGRSGLSGGATGSWGAANIGSVGFARINSSATAYNGFLYIVGGQTVGSPNTPINDVTFARICDGVTTSNGCSSGGSNAGKLGNWTTASNLFTTVRTATTPFAYNGYLYIVGGSSSNNVAYADTQFALICTGSNSGVGGCGSTPGDLGTWYYGNGTNTQAGSAGVDGSRMNKAAAAAATFVYNGYIYVVGGCDNLPISACFGNVNTVIQKASIRGNGTIGLWSNLAVGLPASIYVGGGGVGYNGYVYLTGGCTNKNGLNTACTAWGSYRASINSDGTLNTWVSITNPVSDHSGTTGAYNGYLYYATFGATNKVYMAKIYSSGTVGPWHTSNAYGTARYSSTYVFYGNYVYLVVGCTNSSLNCQSPNGSTTDIQLSTISSALGATSSYFGSGTVASSAVMYGATVAYNGYVYIIGGSTSYTGTASAQLGTVQYAKINADGSLNAWTTSSTSMNQTQTGVAFCGTAGNCPGRVQVAAAVYNGYLYIAGGRSNGGGNVWSDVQSAPLNASTGAPGTWTTIIQDFTTNSSTYSNVNGIAAMSMQIYNGYMYLIGGSQGTAGAANAVNTIYYSPLTSTGGAGLFNPTTTLPNIRQNSQSFISNGRLYVVGGGNGTNNDNDDVIFTSINANGTLASSCPSGYTCATTPWVDANAVANGGSGNSFAAASAMGAFSANFSNGYLYVSGGAFGAAAAFNSVYAAKMNPNGSFGAWSTLTSFSTGRVYFGQAIVNGFVYIMGGCGQLNVLNPCNSQANVLNDYQYAQIYNGGGGASSAWSTTTNTPNSTAAGGSIALNGYLYTIGGCTALMCTGGAATTAVNHAAINRDGTLGSWTANGVDTALGTGRAAFGIATYNGAIYISGGMLNGGSATNTVYYATPAANGNITSWIPTSSFNVARIYLGMFAYNGYLYINGGQLASASTACNTVSSSNCNDIQFAPINANGSLGAWHFTHNSTDDGTSYVNGFTTGRFTHSTVVNNGYAYIIGGYDSTNVFNDIQYAQLNANGTIGTWSVNNYLPKPRYNAVAGFYGGYLYIYQGASSSGIVPDVSYAPVFSNGVLGNWTVSGEAITGSAGQSGFGTGAFANGYIYYMNGQTIAPVPDVQYASLQTTPLIAHYSMALSTDKPTGPANFFSLVSPQNSNSSISVGAAFGASSSSPDFGNISTTNNVTSVTKYPISTTNSGAMYYWVPITINDSQSMVYGESSGSTLSYLQLNYHPNPSMRLRGGKTFNNSVQQSLDAQ